MDNFKAWEKHLNAELSKIPFTGQLEKKVGISKVYLFLGLMGLFALAVLVSNLAPLLVNVVGWLYPMLASIHALHTADTKDDTLWLTYWVVFGAFAVAEYFTSFILYYIPLYFAFKLAFLVWLMAPYSKGAVVMYDKFIRPNYLAGKEKLMAGQDKLANAINQVLEKEKEKENGNGNGKKDN